MLSSSGPIIILMTTLFYVAGIGAICIRRHQCRHVVCTLKSKPKPKSPISLALSLTPVFAASSWLGASDQRDVSVFATAQCCSSVLHTGGRMAWLSRPRVIVCKFPAHMDYAVAPLFATGSAEELSDCKSSALPLGHHAPSISACHTQ